MRGAGLVWSPLLGAGGRAHQGLLTIQDWLPTLYSAAGGRPGDLDAMDGMDMWPSLRGDHQPPRKTVGTNFFDNSNS